MGGSSGDVDAPDVKGAAEVEAEARRRAAQNELWANRPDQFGPMGSTTWDSVMIDANTGRPIVKDENGDWQFADGGPAALMPGENDGPKQGALGDPSPGSIDAVSDWTQNTTLTPEWQKILEERQGLISDKTGAQATQIQDWQNNPNDFSDIGGGNLGSTIGRGDLDQFGQQSANMGAQDWRQFGTSDAQISGDDWRQFGTTEQTLGANDYQQFGKTDQTIGANDYQQFGTSDAQITGDDWRQFGTTEQTVNSGDWDARFGSDDSSGGFGDHGMGNSNWDQIQYSPEAIRNKAEQDTLSFMNAQLDPQWEAKQNDLEVQLANKGLQAGDAQYDRAMESMKNSRSTAYAGARNQALADSRAEANMLWGQEMSRSEQKNQQTQADLDNVYRARQSNISNYQGQRGQDMQGYLAYQDAAFNQDLSSRQQQLDANLNYGSEGFKQDLMGRQQQLDADLGYGREAFGQDLASRQQQLDADLNYGNAAFGQDLSSRQQQLDANLAYGKEGFQQDYMGRQQQLDANRLYSAEAFNQDYQSRQANISNFLNFGNAEFDQNLSKQELDLEARIAQEQLDQRRFGLMDANPDISTITDALG